MDDFKLPEPSKPKEDDRLQITDDRFSKFTILNTNTFCYLISVICYLSLNLFQALPQLLVSRFSRLDSVSYCAAERSPETSGSILSHPHFLTFQTSKEDDRFLRLTILNTNTFLFLSCYGVGWMDGDKYITFPILDFQRRGLFLLECVVLSPGVYHLQVWNNGQLVKSEKLMLKP